MIRLLLAVHPRIPNIRVHKPTMSTASSDPATKAAPTSGPSHSPFFRGNIGPPLRTFTDAAAAPAAHVRILPAIQHDHRELSSHSHKILTSTNPDEQTRYQNQFIWELARHTIGEELVVYPAIAKHVQDGPDIAAKNRHEHQSIKEQLKTFQELPSTDPRFVPTLQSLMRDLDRHIRQEENEDLGLLEEALSQADSEALSRSFERTKMFLPSRSHPLAPSKPPFETAVGLLTAPMDLVSDIFRKWPHVQDDKKKNK
ncbi:hypothetical protein NUU61_003300 [Penicillium alfredii]|uniref:Hemerythrin-like domain-containing protein n=1 Tax=Penicillium alfredii TaxID=1506179 RepID=A0A9W9FT76_9EURO|nr:uncharacterized protein NUU61_003300 [Penicillium alfredii]KAJ5105953.1 hypothetical protein NUU61_003300 [Penicillium alfredii]